MLRLLCFLALAFAACKSSPFPDQKLWRLRTLEGQAVPDSVRTTLQFNKADKSYAGGAACNSYRGTYTLNAEALTLGPAISTKRFCPAMQWETNYFAILPRVAGYRVNGEKLELLDGNKAVLAEYGPE
jgi:heat shock protein HslJ